MKKFDIISVSKSYELTIKNKRDVMMLPILSYSIIENNYVKNELYIAKEAGNQIFNYIHWGNKTEKNEVEQGGILVGHVFKDDKDNSQLFGFVKKAIIAKYSKGLSNYLEMNHNTWKFMFDQLDKINESKYLENMQVIGWFHTHTNHLPVYMSEIDIATQNRFFSEDWQFAIVLNPHQQIWKAFNGKYGLECKGFMLDEYIEI